MPALGSAWEDAGVQAFVARWPQRAWIDDADVKKVRAERRLSMLDEARGLYLFFTGIDSHAARYGAPQGSGTSILSRISMTLDFHAAWSRFAGALPLGLRGDEDAAALLQRLGTPAQTWMAGAAVSKARWRDAGCDVDVAFRDGGSRIALSNDPRFAAFQLAAKAKEIAKYGEADCAHTLGMELYFKPGADMAHSVPNAPSTAEPCLSGARYRADLDFASNGYAGP